MLLACVLLHAFSAAYLPLCIPWQIHELYMFRGIGKEAIEILGSKAGGRRRRDMISCRKGARSNARDEIDEIACVCDRILFEKAQG